MKRFIVGFALAVPLAISAAISSPDSSFYKDAAEGGIAEVEMGNLAQQKSTNPRVKSFGAMMVKDHSAANVKLKSIAAAKNIDLPTSSSIGEMASMTKLKALSGDTFDKSYIKGMIKDHQDDIAMFQKEAASGQDADAKTFAVATLPTLQAHLKAIQSIAEASGLSTD